LRLRSRICFYFYFYLLLLFQIILILPESLLIYVYVYIYISLSFYLYTPMNKNNKTHMYIYINKYNIFKKSFIPNHGYLILHSLKVTPSPSWVKPRKRKILTRNWSRRTSGHGKKMCRPWSQLAGNITGNLALIRGN
jgi:hypothetical protein